MLHSIRSQFKILFTKDESIIEWVQNQPRSNLTTWPSLSCGGWPE